MTNTMILLPIGQNERKNYLNYLLLADESEEVVNTYLNDGEMFAIQYNQEIAGAALFTFHPNYVVELKNIALNPACQGKGAGKLVVCKAFAYYKERGFRKMIVGTANSSIGNLAFYQKAGFRMTAIRKGFFEKYPEPIFEDGIRALDMVMFEKDLTENEEWISVFDENRNKIGVASRKEVHQKGFWHETFQCWFVDQNDIYFQIRSNDKKDYPSLLDITAAGHILADETIEDGVREIEEELGIAITYDDLQAAGIIEDSIVTDAIIDREFAHVFVYEARSPLSFKLQREEVAGMVRADFTDFYHFCLGKTNELKVSGFIVNASGKEAVIEKYATKQDFVPHPPSYWLKVATAIEDILRK